MIDKVYARQLKHGLWQWRLRQGDEWQHEGYYTGDNEALENSLEGAVDTPICMLMAGESCVGRVEKAEVTNKRTLVQMLPYEMEDDIIDAIDDLHFTFGEIHEGSIPVLYTRIDSLQALVENLSEVGGDIQEIFPDYLLLEREESEMVVVWDEDKILVHNGVGKGCCVEANIAAILLNQLEIDSSIRRVRICALESQQRDAMVNWLPKSLTEEGGPDIELVEGGYWDCLDPGVDVGFNFRSGRFARQLPFVKWWQTWKIPTYFAAAAFVFAVLVNIGLFSEAKGEYQQIMNERKEVFLQAVPNGRWQTPERELRARLGDNKDSNEPSNFIVLLQGIAQALQEKESIELSSMRYSGDQKEIVISFEAANFSDVESLRAAIEALGFSAKTLRAAAQGEVFQARMSVSGAAA